METQTFRVYSLDVWGHVESDPKDCDCEHECPGFSINDRGKVGTVEVNATPQTYNKGKIGEFTSLDCTDEDVIKALVAAGYLTADCTEETIEVDGDGDYMLEVNRKSDGRYLLQLERDKEV